MCVTPFLESKDRVCFLSCFLLFLQPHGSSGSRAASRAEGQRLIVGQDGGAPRLMGTKVGPPWLSLASLSVKVSRADLCVHEKICNPVVGRTTTGVQMMMFSPVKSW